MPTAMVYDRAPGHARTHTHVRAHTHAHTRTHVRAHAHARTRAHTRVRTRTHAPAYAQAYAPVENASRARQATPPGLGGKPGRGFGRPAGRVATCPICLQRVPVTRKWGALAPHQCVVVAGVRP